MDRYQLAAARGMLGWSQKELSAKTSLTPEALNRIERGEVTNPRESTMRLIRQCFEEHGIEFIEQSGIRRKSQSLHVGYGTTALENLFNRIYEYAVLTNGESELLCSGFSMQDSLNYFNDDFINMHIKRMMSFGNKSLFKTLIAESDRNKNEVGYSQYKKLKDVFFYGTPFYVFGESLAIISWDEPVQVITIQNRNIAEVFRRQFHAMWQLASAHKD
jgi:transcriptional regulator with XRE-family HTH domain